VPDEQEVVASDRRIDDLSPYTTLDLDKFWNVLLFLLSHEYRRRQPSNLFEAAYEDPLAWAVIGVQPIDYRNSGGYPLRVSHPANIRDILDVLSGVTYDDLRPHADREAMIEASVYRQRDHSPDRPDAEKTYDLIVQRLRQHYRNAATHGQVMIYERV